MLFQSTHPTRGCDTILSTHDRIVAFQSTHPTRGCDINTAAINANTTISIHAPHEGVRLPQFCAGRTRTYFNPRTPRGGATGIAFTIWRNSYFNPRTPRGGATLKLPPYTLDNNFNPRTPRGGATFDCRTPARCRYFNPRTPRGGATFILLS